MHRRSFISVLALALLGGCAVAPVPVVVTGPTIGPPPPQVEVLNAPPAPHWYWVPGYWSWNGARYAWVGGHWVEPRVGEVYVQACWSVDNGVWIFHTGHWRRIEAPAGYAVVTAPNPPPPPRIEVIPEPPGPQYFWINGHWRWDGATHVWVPGHWEAHRAGASWVPAHWVFQGGVWRFAGGHWQPA